MIDRRFLVGALGALLGLTAGDALAARKKTSKKAPAKKSKATKKGRKAAPKKKGPPPKPAPPPPPPVPEITDPETAAALKSAFDAILHDMLIASPALATSAGLDKGQYAALKSQLDDRSEAGKAATITRLKRAIDRLTGIPRTQLSAVDRINYDTVLWDVTNQQTLWRNFPIGDNSLFCNSFPTPYLLCQLSGAYQYIPDFLDSQHTIENAADAQAYIARLQAFAAILDQETARVKNDFARGILPPDFVVKATIGQLTRLRDTDPAASTLINSVATRSEAKGIAGDWREQATAIVTGPVKDALSRQIEALETVQGRALHDAGVKFMANGEAYYGQCVKLNTSTSLTAREIHKVGLQKVGDISTELDQRFRALGRSQGTVAERIQSMYKDPQYLYPNDDDGKAKMLADLNGKVAAVNALQPRYFGVKPRTQVEVRRVPVATEAGAPGGYYLPGSLDGSRPGVYYINLRDISEIPSWTLPTLTYHEAVPGHHMQVSIQQENENLPQVRRLGNFNAYIEGWALYSEQLAADDMGMYANDPAGRIGYLHDALFRAVRLVVDTGIHAQGWSREQAITYMVDTCGKAIGFATAEVERYCAWPGQALGYMVGKIEWLRLRDAMRAKQGGNFDIKRFHDTGLLCGAVPLDVLEDVYKSADLI